MLKLILPHVKSPNIHVSTWSHNVNAHSVNVNYHCCYCLTGWQALGRNEDLLIYFLVFVVTGH